MVRNKDNSGLTRLKRFINMTDIIRPHCCVFPRSSLPTNQFDGEDRNGAQAEWNTWISVPPEELRCWWVMRSWDIKDRFVHFFTILRQKQREEGRESPIFELFELACIIKKSPVWHLANSIRLFCSTRCATILFWSATDIRQSKPLPSLDIRSSSYPNFKAGN